MAEPGLEDWERQRIDYAVVLRDVVLQQIPRAFFEQHAALWLLDATPEQVNTALDRLYAEILAAAKQGIAQARQEAQLCSPERAG